MHSPSALHAPNGLLEQCASQHTDLDLFGPGVAEGGTAVEIRVAPLMHVYRLQQLAILFDGDCVVHLRGASALESVQQTPLRIGVPNMPGSGIKVVLGLRYGCGAAHHWRAVASDPTLVVAGDVLVADVVYAPDEEFPSACVYPARLTVRRPRDELRDEGSRPNDAR